MRLFLFLLLTGLAVSGCGQKGPLYKSPAAEANKASPQQEAELASGQADAPASDGVVAPSHQQ